jgi:hypothetical protein
MARFLTILNLVNYWLYLNSKTIIFSGELVNYPLNGLNRLDFDEMNIAILTFRSKSDILNPEIIKNKLVWKI